jgi:tRNA(Ile2)-agmatinylcytidine synthase
LEKKINETKKNGIKIEGFPHIIRLNPFARLKTRGNGAVSFKIAFCKDENLIKKIVLDKVKLLSRVDCENTNPRIVFYKGEITKEKC